MIEEIEEDSLQDEIQKLTGELLGKNIATNEILTVEIRYIDVEFTFVKIRMKDEFCCTVGLENKDILDLAQVIRKLKYG
jgi:hypothetical protein